jgi:hypothetical protein
MVACGHTIGAAVALDALRGIPARNHDGDAALLVGRSAELPLAVGVLLKAETGRLSPSIMLIGVRSSLTCLTMASRPSRVRVRAS